MTEVKKIQLPANGNGKKAWRLIKGYTRDHLMAKLNGTKDLSVGAVLAKGKELGLKEVTVKIKIGRWIKEGKVSRKDENLVLAV